jgi:hypothetical protein
MRNILIFIILCATVSVRADVPADTVSSGVVRANQLIAVDPLPTDSSVAKQRNAIRPHQVTSDGLLDDIGLMPSKKVVFCDLGLIIRNVDGSDVSVAVHDAKGRAIVTKDFSDGQRTINMDLGTMPKGVYVYTVRMADSVYTKPFVVTR